MKFFKANKNTYVGGNASLKITMLGLLFALTLVIQYITQWFEWPMANFLKFDFSLLPIIIILFLYDFFAAFLVLMIRLAFEMMLSHDGVAFWYGPLMQLQVAFLTLFFIMLTYVLLSKTKMTNGKALIIALFVATFIEVIYATMSNWLWSTPLYLKLRGQYHGDITLAAFSEYYKTHLAHAPAFIPTAGFPNWHIAAWTTFGIFNTIKFSVIAIVAFPVIRFVHIHATSERMHVRKKLDIFDSHVHLAWNDKMSKKIIEVVKEENINILPVSSNVNDMERTHKLANKLNLKFGLGNAYMNPSKKDSMKAIEILNKYKNDISIVGEIGLDFDLNDDLHEQKFNFEKQVKFAIEHNLPIAVHLKGRTNSVGRELLKRWNFKNDIILHNYNGDAKETAAWLKMNNVYFSFGNQALYDDYQHVVNSIKLVPMKRILIETDSPGFPTRENLGKVKFDEQTPTNIHYVIDKVSKLKRVSKRRLINRTNININKILK